MLPVLDVLGRSPFVFVGPAPAGFDHAVLSVASAPVTSATPFVPSVIRYRRRARWPVTWTVTGTVRNTTSTTMRSVRVFVTEYDTLGNVIGGGLRHAVDRRRSARAGRRTFSVRSGRSVPP